MFYIMATCGSPRLPSRAGREFPATCRRHLSKLGQANDQFRSGLDRRAWLRCYPSETRERLELGTVGFW
jgi:hypothetical protein